MISYQDHLQGIDAVWLTGFFQKWKKPYSPAKHLEILQKSDHVVLALDTTEQRVVGFITALTDHVNAAFIPLLEVLPEYRKRGIGAALVKRMLEKLEDIPNVDLTCTPALQSFYVQFGLSPSHGMVLRKYLS